MTGGDAPSNGTYADVADPIIRSKYEQGSGTEELPDFYWGPNSEPFKTGQPTEGGEDQSTKGLHVEENFHKEIKNCFLKY